MLSPRSPTHIPAIPLPLGSKPVLTGSLWSFPLLSEAWAGHAPQGIMNIFSLKKLVDSIFFFWSFFSCFFFPFKKNLVSSILRHAHHIAQSDRGVAPAGTEAYRGAVLSSTPQPSVATGPPTGVCHPGRCWRTNSYWILGLLLQSLSWSQYYYTCWVL